MKHILEKRVFLWGHCQNISDDPRSHNFSVIEWIMIWTLRAVETSVSDLELESLLWQVISRGSMLISDLELGLYSVRCDTPFRKLLEASL